MHQPLCSPQQWNALVPVLMNEGVTDGALMTLWALYFVVDGPNADAMGTKDERTLKLDRKALADWRVLGTRQITRHLTELETCRVVRVEGSRVVLRSAEVVQN